MSDLSDFLGNASLTLDDVLCELRHAHYIVEGRGRVGRFCSRTTIGIIERDFIPSYEAATGTCIDDIVLLATATDDGLPGNFTYAVFNAEKVDLDRIHEILKWTNSLEAAHQTTEAEIARIDKLIAARKDEEYPV